MTNRLHIALAVAIILAGFYLAAQASGSLLAPLTDVLFVIVSGATAALAYRVVKALGGKESAAFLSLRQKMLPVHLGFFLAIFFWFLGEFTWTFYEVVLRVEVPYPSVADIFYLAGYIPLILTTLQFMWLFRKIVTKTKVAASILSGVLILGLMFAFLLQPLGVSSSSALTKGFDLAYPSLDAILLALVSAELIGFSGTSIGKPLLWILGGLFVYSIADIMFSWGTLVGWYYSGHPIELLWLYGYLGLAVGFTSQRAEFQALINRAADSQPIG